MTDDILGLRQYLIDQQVTGVLMESTSDYWKPFYYLLEDAGFELILANARHVKNIPGRKSDVNDATWLSDLCAHRLVRSSFVPPAPIRALRDLTRSREVITHERTRKIARLEKQLEDAGIKLSSVASNLSGVSCHDMLTAMVAGQRDPIALSELARGSMRNKRPDLQRALTGRFTEHHAFLVRMSLERIAQDDAAIAALTQRIEAQIEPFRSFRDLICAIPGISTTVADVIIAETGADMSVFPTAGHLAAWAGVAPGQNESAGRTGSTTARPGDSHLKGALGIAAMSVSRTRNTRLGARYHRIAARRGKLKAIVAIERTLLSIVWAMGHTGQPYQEPGADYYTRLRPDRTKTRALKMLRDLGYTVTLTPAA
ncbi:transposase [Flexivirga oryzae]|jgi:transposase|uniref:Transposase n=2 Tax=Flexivirga oryzae TaxID=1794944 RepID=A0A839NBP9_9MICO|nr:transposase [Flexivirga oryzae]MBB2893066.1 transposase [Flexivirga oryzae]MBB2894357.1 transposase [Flexivirga oryzae]